ncbi:hypothetical protein CEXT_122751 [Caerostris extrusa]|uniref:Uncharacterized protein n=1 Tax=Caerostris extrusa TaxID=172846 RepID=A0AAV4UZY3_CAEEX|nr:hypothetical protein CEXT_122751 [Caerostris extrusa]
MGWEQRNHLRWGSNKMRNPEFREYREKVNPWDLVSLTAHRDQRDARLGLAQKTSPPSRQPSRRQGQEEIRRMHVLGFCRKCCEH